MASWQKRVNNRTTSTTPYPMPKFDGDPSTGKRSMWEKAAIACIENGFDPDKLVDAVFHERTGGLIYPNTLISAKTFHSYSVVSEGRSRLIERDLIAQQSAAYTAWNSAKVLYDLKSSDAWEYVLLSSSSDFSPLYRYAAAELEGLTDIADKWLSSALEQYLCSPKEYDDIWKDLIPDRLKQLASGIMASSN